MLRISATALTYLKNRRRGILPRPQRVHRNCTLFLHEPNQIDRRLGRATAKPNTNEPLIRSGWRPNPSGEETSPLRFRV